MKGRFITFEGGEGAGKSTQVKRLSSRLTKRGLDVITTREPGGTPRAERIRKMILSGRAKALGPMAEAMLFAAARTDHLDTLIRPALSRGAWVICDRFADSTRVYQGYAGRLDPATLASLERITVESTRPDLTLVLDISPEVGLKRIADRQVSNEERPDRFERESLKYHQTLREGFLYLAANEPDRCIVIDAEFDPNEVEDMIWSVIEAHFFTSPGSRSGPSAGNR